LFLIYTNLIHFLSLFHLKLIWWCIYFKTIIITRIINLHLSLGCMTIKGKIGVRTL
jgi:hypothetical protein